MIERVYFPISEELARRAKQMMSFDDYDEGSQTKAYRECVDNAFNYVDMIAEQRPAELSRAIRVATTYSRRLADNMNKQNRIGTMCPSIMISGGSNFPVKKKEKQVAAMDSAMKEWKEITGYLDRLMAILHGKSIIKANDEDAILRLEAKISEKVALQEWMKEVNAYYRKHGTLKDCPELTDMQVEKMEADRKQSWRADRWRPFASYSLTNNNAEIRRLKKRLEDLKTIKNEGDSEQEYDGFTVKMNTEDVRIEIYFDDKPEPEVRAVLKSNGFHWARSKGAWQRQITTSGKYALKRVIEELT